MFHPLSDGFVELFLLDRFSWETYANLTVSEAQTAFLPNNLFSIAQSRFESGSEVLGIAYQGKPAGMVIYLLSTGGVCFISRIMVEAAQQGMGIGKRSLRLLLDYLSKRPQVREIRTSVTEENTLALGFFKQQGFKPLGVPMDGEVVLIWRK